VRNQLLQLIIVTQLSLVQLLKKYDLHVLYRRVKASNISAIMNQERVLKLLCLQSTAYMFDEIEMQLLLDIYLFFH